MMIELFGAGVSRWVKCYWMLKELEVPFKEHQLNLREGEQQQPAMLAMNPFGRVPFMRDGNVVLFESMAIINYLGEKYPESGLVPTSGTLARAYYDQWTAFGITDLEQPLWRMIKHSFILPENMRLPEDVELAKEEFNRIATVLDQQIGNKTFITNDRFTAADIVLTYTLGWALSLELLSSYQNCLRYFKEHTSRPAFPAHLYQR